MSYTPDVVTKQMLDAAIAPLQARITEIEKALEGVETALKEFGNSPASPSQSLSR